MFAWKRCGIRAHAPPHPPTPGSNKRKGMRKVDIRLPGKGNSNSHGARPVLLIITMINWIRIRKLSIKTSLSSSLPHARQVVTMATFPTRNPKPESRTASERRCTNLQFQGTLPERQGHLALAVLYVPHLLDSGMTVLKWWQVMALAAAADQASVARHARSWDQVETLNS